ncbi:MAG: DUF4493 domain-containing protein [Tannerellaceae bacterium]|nr:DUF4493 domain-containing protein [Tannerellaceae bacterium]
MKHTIYITFLWIGWVMMGITSCELQKDLMGKGDNTDNPSIDPNLLGGLSLVLNPEKEAEVPSKTDGVSGSDIVVLDMNQFSVQILDEEGELIKYYNTYKEIEQEGTIFLPEGAYYIQASLGDLVEAGFDMPYYEGINTCVITPKEVASVITKCVLANKKITLSYTDKFLAKFKSDYKIIMTNGAGVLTLGHNETRVPYFKSSDRLDFIIHTTTVEGLDLTYSMNLFEDDDVSSHNNILVDLDVVPDTDTKPDPGPDPREPEPEEPGEGEQPTLVVNISLINREYVIEIPSNFVNPDEGGGNNSGGGEGAPTITGTGLSTPIEMTVADALEKGATVRVTISTPMGIKSLEALITSTNTEFMETISIMGLDKSFDMLNLNPELENTLVNDVGLALPSDPYSNIFDISQFVKLMAVFSDGGTYRFKLTVTDVEGNSASETLTIILTK